MTTSIADIGVTFADGNFQTYAQSPVRQTVVNGPVDANGQSAFGGATGATTVTAAGTIYLSAANGMTNRNSAALVNPSWTGLSTTGTMYLYATINVDGTCTLGSTTLLPTYQFGGTFSTTAGQYTYNIQQMQMQVGNGTTAAQSYTVFVGEVTVASSLVSAITWYALMGRSYRTIASPAASTNYTAVHNIGLQPQFVETITGFVDTSAVFWQSAANGYTSGADSAAGYGGLLYLYSNRLTSLTSTGSNFAVYGSVNLTFANCAAIVFQQKRIW